MQRAKNNGLQHHYTFTLTPIHTYKLLPCGLERVVIRSWWQPPLVHFL